MRIGVDITHGRKLLCGPLLLTGACALAPMMPPLSRSDLPSVPSLQREATSPAFASAPHSVRTPLRVEHNSSENLTRVSVMTHGGRYFLWFQRPQLTWFYVYTGSAPVSAPAEVFLVFRTQSPQSIRDNRLQLICSGVSTPVPGLPTSEVRPGIQTTSHYLTFAVPLPLFMSFSRCGESAVEVGGVRADFSMEQAHELEVLADSWR